MVYVLWVVAIVVCGFLVVQAVRCRAAVQRSYERLEEYDAATVRLSYGDLRYVDRGSGEVILSVHGLFGGFDQALDNCEGFADQFRVIAPARFGYLGSDVRGEGTPADQAAAFVELLDHLGIEKVFVLGASAGGTIAIRFALDYPERTKGLMLLSSAMPYAERPQRWVRYAGPPRLLTNDFGMFLISPLFGLVMGIRPDTIVTMMPISERRRGVLLDATVANPDMARNFDSYEVEKLRSPTLVLHAQDDKVVSFTQTRDAVARFPGCTFVSFESGGHMLEGHSEEVVDAICRFASSRRRD
ncbi:alpha/beta fold hydrolase [Corynebacterium sp.]|uniref:alpha/beta fold hydrolase n=1 Tax=Corynebacterium sp. TaxID=1720 RepID=UPI0026DB16C4|nr:alpha/beta hydrolase [Corynebacterium sp.]MDO5077979.1 alpha/beta hydrolase [Corynebacterium sp.]